LRDYVGNEVIQRIAIPPPPANSMEIFTDKQKHHISLDKIRNHIRSGCKVCLDMTAENADLSVGMAEGFDGLNTVIIRSDIGKKLFEQACNENLLKKKPYDEKLLKYLQQASMNKKIKAIREADRRPASSDYYQYLKMLRGKIIS
jgi:coenzyme F420 hydrogenase subunit beta